VCSDNVVHSASSEADFVGVVGWKVGFNFRKPVISGCRRCEAAGGHQAGEKSGVDERITAASAAAATVTSPST